MSVSIRQPLRYERTRTRAGSVPPPVADAPPPLQHSVVASRLPAAFTSGRFAIGVAMILVAGLVALLAVNTSLAAGSMRLGALEGSLARAQEKEQALAVEVEERSAPAALQAEAIRLGMVPAEAPAFLDPATGVITGNLAPGGASPRKGVVAPQVTKPAPPATPSPSVPAASPTTPEPTAGAPTDAGADGAVLPTHEPVPSPPAIAPTPAAALSAPAGDGAALVTGAGD